MNSIANKNINSGVLLTIFLVIYPFLVFPWDVFYITKTKLMYLTLFTIILWYDFSLHWLKRKRPLFVPHTVGERLLLLFLLLLSLSTLFAQDLNIAFFGSYSKYLGFIAWFCYITFFFISFNQINIHKQITILQYIIYASFFCGLYGIFQHFYIEIIVGYDMNVKFVSSWAFFDNTNHFGTYLLIMIILGMTMYLVSKNRILLFVNGVILCTLFVSLLYTMTRGAWLASFIGVVLLTLLVWKKRELWKRWLLLLFSLCIVMLIVNFSENNFLLGRIISIGDDFQSLVTEDDDEAGSGRWGIWKETFPEIKEHYLLGSGPGSYPKLFPDSSVDNSHNEYIEIALTMGIPALLVYLACIFVILKKGYLTLKQLDGDQKIYLYGLMTTIICYLIKVMFNISVIPVAPYFWVLLGMCYAFSRKIRTTN